jgi:hypothetical protein
MSTTSNSRELTRTDSSLSVPCGKRCRGHSHVRLVECFREHRILTASVCHVHVPPGVSRR